MASRMRLRTTKRSASCDEGSGRLVRAGLFCFIEQLLDPLRLKAFDGGSIDHHYRREPVAAAQELIARGSVRVQVEHGKCHALV